MKPPSATCSGTTRLFERLLLFLFILLASSCSENDNPVATQTPTPDSTWTYIVYDAADGSAVSIYDNYLVGLAVRSGQYINLMGLRDSEDTEGIYWRIDDLNNYIALDTLGEINTGSEETLYDLVMYAKANYPADRYIISFYGHGAAYYGCCADVNPKDALRMHEIRSALNRAGGVDMVLFTAPCIMGSIEVAYELRDCTDIVMASEGMSCFLYWQYALDDAFAAIHDDPVITPTAVAELIIEQMPVYMPQYALFDSDSFLTMAAVRTDKLAPLRRAIDDLATAYLADTTAFEAIVDLNYDDLFTFGAEAGSGDFLVDIKSLSQRLLLTETDNNIRSLLQAVPDRLGEAVFAECHFDTFDGVGGLSIFLPQSDFQWLSYYTGGQDMTLDFARDTSWDELVSVLIETTSMSSATPPWSIESTIFPRLSDKQPSDSWKKN